MTPGLWVGRPRSLRARMTLGFTAAFAAFVVVVCALILVWARQTARREALTLTDDALAVIRAEWRKDGDHATIADALGEVREATHLSPVAVRVLDAGGKTVATSRHLAPPARDGDWFISTGTVGGYTFVAGINDEPMDAALRRQTLLLLTLGLVSVGGMALLTWTLVGSTLRPIGALAEQADRASGAGAVPEGGRMLLEAPSPDSEVERLVETLNAMLDRIRENARVREQFYAAAAHELRTPLTVLFGNIDLALSRPRPVAEHEETLRDLRTQTQRLISLAESLLLLNRLDGSATREAASLVEIADVCERTLTTQRDAIAARHLCVSADYGDAETAVAAPASHVAVLIRNLIENAVRYTPPGGTVGVCVGVRQSGVALSVRNDFPHPEGLDFARLGQAFYRPDVSRSADSGGNGLGLAICYRVARANGWDFRLEPGADSVAATVIFAAATVAAVATAPPCTSPTA